MNTTQQLEKSMARQERLYALYCFLSLVKEGAPNLAGAPPAANEAMFLLANRITGMESPELDRVTAGKSLDEWVEDFERDMPKSPFEEEEVVFGPKDMASNSIRRDIAIENQKWAFALAVFIEKNFNPPPELRVLLGRFGRQLAWGEVRFELQEPDAARSISKKVIHFEQSTSVGGEEQEELCYDDLFIMARIIRLLENYAATSPESESAATNAALCAANFLKIFIDNYTGRSEGE